MIAELNIPTHRPLSADTSEMLFDLDAFVRWQSVSVNGKHTNLLIVRLEASREDNVIDLAHLLCAQLEVEAIAVHLPQLNYGRWVGPGAAGMVFDLDAFVPYVVAQAQHH